MFQAVFELNDGETSNWMAKTLSTDELIEKVLLERAFAGGMYLSSPTGQIMKMDVPFFKADTNFHSIMNSTPVFFSEDFDHFGLTAITPQRLESIQRLEDEGKDPWFALREERGFCSLNYYYDRGTYCVSLEVYQRLRSVSDEYFSTELLRVGEHIIRPFEGWSMCVSDETASNLSSEKLYENLKLKALCEALQLDENDYEPMPKKSVNAVGRPKLSGAAAKAFLKHFSLDDKPSWKEAINTLRTVEGLDVSARTLQRGLKEISEDKTRS